jgi:hypothetical protein
MGDSQTDPAVGINYQRLSYLLKLNKTPVNHLRLFYELKVLKICGFVKQASASFSEF